MSAAIQSPAQLDPAANFAPIKPLMELKRGGRKPDSRIQKAIQERFQHFHRKDKNVFKEIVNVGQLINLFLNGKQFPVRNPVDGSWGVLPITGNANSDRRALNIMNNIKTNLLGKWENSSPDILIRPGRNLDTCVSAAKAADTVNNFYERQFYNHHFTQQEGLMGMTFGTYIDRYRFDDSKVSMSVIQDIFEQKDAQFGEGFGYCADCEYAGNDSEFKSEMGGDGPMARSTCPQCRSTAVDVMDAPKGGLFSASGQEKKQVGDLVCEMLPMPACRWDLSRRPEDSNYFIYRQKIPKGAVTRVLGNVLLPQGNTDHDYGLEVLEALGKQGAALGGFALRHDTPIITPDGWKEIWEIGVGDQVFSDDGKPCNVTWNSGLMVDRPCYEVEFADGSVITADEDHLWHTFSHAEREKSKKCSTEWRLKRQSKRKKEWKPSGERQSQPLQAARNALKVYLPIAAPTGTVLSTKEIADTLTVRNGQRYNHAVRNQPPLEYPEQVLPIDPYVLGAWLGDGTSSGTGITVGPEDIDAMRPISASGIELTKHGSDTFGYGIGGKKSARARNVSGRFIVEEDSMYSRLRDLNLLGNKHIPATYLRGSAAQRLALLQGLMDTDGSVETSRGRCEFTTTIIPLRDGFTELISSLGIRGSYGYRPASTMKAVYSDKIYNQKEQWRIAFRSEMPVFRLPRKLNFQKRKFEHDPKWLRIVAVRPVESQPVCCISIDAPSRCYLAGPTMIPTHNSAYGNRRNQDDDGEDRDSVTFDELWMSPDCYADINLIGDEETVDGPTIPKGKLVDVFPDGLCAVGLNGMAVVLALYPEKHKSHIVSGTWFMQSQTGAGRGLADLVEIQKQFNTLNNQAAAYMSSTYTPAIMYDNQLVTGNKMKYIGTPKTNIPVDLTKLPEGRKLADAIHQMQPTAMPAQFFNYSQNFMNIMAQKTSMASDFANGEPGITAQNTTATAAEIDQGNADSINQPIFLIKADARKRGAEITINLFREHFPIKRYFDLGGKFGQQQGIELSSADLQADLVYEVVRNSEMPKGPYTRQKNRMQFFNVIGGMEGLALGQQSFPKVLAGIAQDFDVDLEVGESFDAVAELCRKRLNQMTQAAKVGASDPQELIRAIDPPISAKEPNLAAKGKWFAEWLDTDQGQSAGMPLRAAAELLTEGQVQGQTAQDAEIATQQGVVAAAGQAPLALGAHALEQDAAQQPESTEPDPTAVLQMQQEQTQQQHEAQEGAADRAHEMAVLDKEHAHEKEAAKVDADHKIRIEKAKPKPAAKAGAKK